MRGRWRARSDRGSAIRDSRDRNAGTVAKACTQPARVPWVRQGGRNLLAVRRRWLECGWCLWIEYPVAFPSQLLVHLPPCGIPPRRMDGCQCNREMKKQCPNLLDSRRVTEVTFHMSVRVYQVLATCGLCKSHAWVATVNRM